MSRLVILLFLCIATTYKPGYCETRTSRDVEHRGLPEFLSELDLSRLEATKEDVEALKKTVKRLAPEKNGEYQVYQVFFGNEDLLKEWLKGAGVTGQPGVDYPALTSIPATSFSCRGLRGGYYADLETNCQVFHICDNGRKISFLCPNGTIFQQSQLICDWWFKVDCSKSTELYEQSAEQLAEQEKKRIETKKIKSEFHRTVEQDNVNYYESNNRDYDGRQNGRTNPYSQSAKQNEIQEKQEKSKSGQHFGPNNVLENARDSNRYYQGNNVNEFQSNEKINRLPEYFNQSPKQQQYHDSRSGDYHTTNRPKNQLLNTQDSKFNYENKNKIQDNYQNYQSNVQNYHQPNQNVPHNEKSRFRNSKSRNNLINQSQKATPTYTETTTFRTTTSSPPKEFQQFAESAAFVSNRENRFNSKSEGNKQSYYQSYDNRDSTIDNRYRDTTTLAPEKSQKIFTPKSSVLPFPSSTFASSYKYRTTTVPSYETTLQYTPTTETSSFYSTPFYKQTNNPGSVYPTTDIVTSSSVQAYPTTEFYDRYNNRQAPVQVGSIPPPTERHYQDNDKRDINRETDTISFATTRPYVNTESYRYNTTSTINQNTYRSSTSSQNDNRSQINRNGNTRAIYQNENNIANSNIKNTTKIPSYSSQGFGQNSISSTEKSWRSTEQQDDSVNNNLKPYDSSFTYKQGKVLSTLGLYVPFTKNYVYSSMTTSTLKPPNYTTNVPNYNTITANYPTTTNNPKGKSLFSVTSRTKDRATYLPEVNTKRSMILENRPYAEREHVLSMLHSLQGLENNANSLSEAAKRGGSGRDIPLTSGPSTLHSLALYFATANDGFDSNGTTDTTVSNDQQQETKERLSASQNTSVDLPTSILTQHTIASYAELFNLNNALEGNSTVTEFRSEDGDENDDLDIEQSEGPLNGAKKSNNTNLRELAQVFTHALSAYLQDPETFKKILTEIRPTEPSAITSDNNGFETTTLYPTTAEEYSSVTKEKDEVLDFSDDIESSRRRKPIFSTTLQPPIITTYYTTPYDEYYSTTFSQTRRPDYYPSTTLLPPTSITDNSRDYIESSTQPASNTFAFEVNHAFGITNDIRNYDTGTTDSTDFSQVYDNYFPLYEDGNKNKISGFRNNKTIQPYGKNVKPFDATPITNYIASSTVPSFEKFETQSWNKGSIGNKPISQELIPPHYQSFSNVKGFEVSNSVIPSQTVRSTTPLPEKIISDSPSTTVHPFRIHYYETTTLPENQKTTPESLVTARSSYVKFRNNYNRIDGTGKSARESETTTQATTTQNAVDILDPVAVTDVNIASYTAAAPFITKNSTNVRNSKLLNNNHWTSSPMVTQLWETTVFVDPRHINHGLESNYDSYSPSTTENSVTEELELLAFASTTAQPVLSTEYPDETTETQSTVNTITSSPWKWTPNDNDAPVTFTLLPSIYSTENTATPTPLITTHSSITTTLTSSVTSTKPASTLLPYTITTHNLNATENEVIRAQEIFGKLNQSSSNMLMRIMKQADNNESVRQLVLLLISYCKAPKNKTVEEEREQLLETLLRMPVNEFTSEESREIVAGINKLSPSIDKVRSVVTPSSTRSPRASSVRTTSEPSITTFHSRTGRKFRTTTERVNNLARRSDQTNLIDIHAGNALSDNKTSISDTRALELLRSLYTIAAKWG